MNTQNSNSKDPTDKILKKIEKINNNYLKEDIISNHEFSDKFQESEIVSKSISSPTNEDEKKTIEDNINNSIRTIVEEKKLSTLHGKIENLKEAKYEYLLYFTLFIVYYAGSLMIPLFLGSLYFEEVFVKRFLNYGEIRNWDTIFDPFLNPLQNFYGFVEIMKDPLVFTIVITFPFVVLGLYLLRQMCSILIVKFFYRTFNRIQQRRELINATPREFRDVNIYHTRNFILRLIKWQFSKGLFPWLVPWMFNFIGANKIGKDVVIEDGYICQEFLEMEDNSYIGQMSIVSSHVLEGIYGALTLKKVIIGKNSVVGAFNLIGPGVEMSDNSQLLPMSASVKFQHLKPNVNYWGLPSHRLSKKRYRNFIQLPLSEEMEFKQKEKNGNNIKNQVKKLED